MPPPIKPPQNSSECHINSFSPSSLVYSPRARQPRSIPACRTIIDHHAWANYFFYRNYICSLFIYYEVLTTRSCLWLAMVNTIPYSIRSRLPRNGTAATALDAKRVSKIQLIYAAIDGCTSLLTYTQRVPFRDRLVNVKKSQWYTNFNTPTFSYS